MLVKAVLKRGDQRLGEFPIDIDGPDDLTAGAKQAFAEFRRAFPALSLFDEDVSIVFEKIEV